MYAHNPASSNMLFEVWISKLKSRGGRGSGISTKESNIYIDRTDTHRKKRTEKLFKNQILFIYKVVVPFPVQLYSDNQQPLCYC